MKKRNRKRSGPALRFCLLGAALLALLGANLLAGSARLTPGEVLALLLAGPGGQGGGRIIWDIRLPRMLTAAVLGGGLSVSGLLLQTYFSNPIAGPYVLGVSSGARLTMALALIVSAARGL